ncbi:putative SOS response-associated peptidase YedK [Breznakia sp. PF5-3]|uniref:SOS response-associated peptidase n=1 Tax=unclassified Breznakia TaxID=2623764 RepID=UPI002404DAF3|nr:MULTISPECIES: SOS response-associated peptidase family protein [unclassified Breznakia]MDF9825749.1 putative SOS response-associated peptidase YedK [Breznakia sp. PM6-1]MDF9836560.1 putative SOS response-associated peptidase YedK [Breznakia sp. PF5-3]MDF9838778.1 putative SOS response-associated peptidase YedK [Breznakia sp. PFB2-8]MDF9860808.1 putative SOS response-associated peptidase YedK [Breznakia sp. PH5-24]
MCGRFVALSETTIRELLKKSDKELDIKDVKYGEVYPTDNALVELERGYQIMNWGAPKWDGKGVIINARQETLIDKQFFKNDFKYHRCIILVEAFYEWDKETPKNKYYVKRKNQDIMMLAGLYKVKDNTPHFVIITQEAIPAFMSIHNRLPLMLNDDEVEPYLNSEDPKQWIKPREYEDLEWKVVNK